MSYTINEVYNCKKCGEEYANILSAKFKWCKRCQENYFKENVTNWTSGNENIDHLIQELQLRVDDPFTTVFEWISYNEFKDVKKIKKNDFATVYSAIWKNGPLHCNYNKEEWTRESNKKVVLKCYNNSQHIANEFLNEVKVYSMSTYSNILKVYGISRNPDTNDYVIVLDYAEGGNFSDWINKNYTYFTWSDKLQALLNIANGLREVHQYQMVHRHLHPGNILFKFQHGHNVSYVSDVGLCGEAGKLDKTKIYGAMPYTAPEVLEGKPYTQAADVYSFGMIMYFVATGKQPFVNYAHDKNLLLNICNGIRPEINEAELPKCFDDLMKRCWNSNPDNRPNSKEIYDLITLFFYSYKMNASKFQLFMLFEKEQQNYEIESQFTEAEKYRKEHTKNRSPQAVYTPQLFNTITRNIQNYDNSSEIINFKKLSIRDLNEYAEKEG